MREAWDKEAGVGMLPLLEGCVASAPSSSCGGPPAAAAAAALAEGEGCSIKSKRMELPPAPIRRAAVEALAVLAALERALREPGALPATATKPWDMVREDWVVATEEATELRRAMPEPGLEDRLTRGDMGDRGGVAVAVVGGQVATAGPFCSWAYKDGT